MISFFFFFNDTATTEIYTLSLHDALPIYRSCELQAPQLAQAGRQLMMHGRQHHAAARELLADRSEEHTSELQSPCNLVCRLLLEKKNPEILPDRAFSRSNALLCISTFVTI